MKKNLPFLAVGVFVFILIGMSNNQVVDNSNEVVKPKTHFKESTSSSTNIHDSFTKILKKHVANGLVNYKGLLADRSDLDKYIDSLGSISRNSYDGWSDNKKIAFWINAYNAATLETIIDHYPISKGFSLKGLAYPKNSIQQISNVWDRDVIHIFGEKISLNTIEHKILRKDFKEPRIHFALVCASIGCPILRDEAFTESKLDYQLDDQAHQFLSDNTKNYFDSNTEELYLSKIFKWFGEDFELDGGVQSFVKKYLKNPLIHQDTRIVWLSYDWSLNEKR